MYVILFLSIQHPDKNPRTNSPHFDLSNTRMPKKHDIGIKVEQKTPYKLTILDKIQEPGYRAGEQKSELFLRKTNWFVQEINEQGKRRIREKLKLCCK